MTSLDRFSDAYGDEFAYSFDNRIMLNWYPTRLTETGDAAERVLELGIGHGYTCNHFADFFASYDVVDGSPAIIDQFRDAFPTSRARVHEAFFETFQPQTTFDLIVMGFVLEHVEEPSEILSRYKGFLAPGGRIAVAVPNAESLHRRIGHAAGVLPDMLALGEADRALGHLRAYTLKSLEAEVEGVGLRVTRREGIFLKPLMTSQLTSLDLGPDIIEGMCRVGVEYPELCAGLLIEASPDP